MNIDPTRIVSAEILAKRSCPACQSRVASNGTIDYQTLTQTGLCEMQTCLVCQGIVVQPSVDITKINANT